MGKSKSSGSFNQGSTGSILGFILGVVGVFLIIRFGIPLIFKAIPGIAVILFALLGSLIVFIILVARHYATIEKRMKNKAVGDGLTQQDLDGIIKEAKSKIRTIDSSVMDLKDYEMKKDVQTISSIAEKIIEVIKKEPLKIRTAKKFLNYYLDATVNILHNYKALQISSSVVEKNEEVIGKVGGTLKDIIKCFEHEYIKLFDETALNLDVEIEVLKASIEQQIR